MPKATKAVITVEKKPVEKKITLTKQQFETLQAISDSITEARLAIGRFNVENLAEAGFTMGKVFARIDKVEDEVSDLIRDIDPDYDDSDNY